MNTDSTTVTTTHSAPGQKPDAAQKLEQARSRVRSVLRDISSTEGRFLDFETAEDMSRALSTVLRELDGLQISIAVMSRKEAVDA
jgi:hypothetical protein